MGIGTSLGAFHEDDFAHVAAPWIDNIDIEPDTLNPQDGTKNDSNHIESHPKTEDFVTQVEFKTASPLVTITDEDINKAMGIAMGTSGNIASGTETVGKAALRYGTDLFEDVNHGMALNKLLSKHDQNALVFHNIEEGFTTSHGRFVDRYEAAKIAKEADQVKGYLPSDVMLLSEDLK